MGGNLIEANVEVGHGGDLGFREPLVQFDVTKKDSDTKEGEEERLEQNQDSDADFLQQQQQQSDPERD